MTRFVFGEMTIDQILLCDTFIGNCQSVTSVFHWVTRPKYKHTKMKKPKHCRLSLTCKHNRGKNKGKGDYKRCQNEPEILNKTCLVLQLQNITTNAVEVQSKRNFPLDLLLGQSWSGGLQVNVISTWLWHWTVVLVSLYQLYCIIISPG